MYRRMHVALKPQRRSTSMVIAPNEDKKYTEDTRKQAIMEHCVKKHSLTHNTPPMHMPIQWELSFVSLPPAGQSI
jgi:hypothetical protein